MIAGQSLSLRYAEPAPFAQGSLLYFVCASQEPPLHKGASAKPKPSLYKGSWNTASFYLLHQLQCAKAPT